MRLLVTGCAGFVGSTLTDALLAAGHSVVGVDNFSTGSEAHLESALRAPQFRLFRADLRGTDALRQAMLGVDVVCHFAANADVRFGALHPRKDLEQNTIVTHNVLEAMREAGVKRIAFASTGSVYGEATVFPTPEAAPFPVQTSLYAASKLAGEALISAYCASFGMQAYVFRMVSIVGERYGHGHVVDFYRQLAHDPNRLRILGDGQQRKSYLYVRDCVDAILLALDAAADSVNIFNLACNDACALHESIDWICAELGVEPTREYAGGDRGWVGDNPCIWLDTARIRALGWTPRLSIRDGIVRTVRYLAACDSVGIAEPRARFRT